MSGTELVKRDGSPVMKPRIRPALRSAIHLIVTEGLSIIDAAHRVGMNYVSLQVALRKPHVRVVRDAVKRAWLESQTDKAWLGMAQLANEAVSEDVRHKSLKVFLDAAGELDGGAAGRVQGPAGLVQIIVNHVPQPGQPLPSRLPGVVEAQPVQGSHRFPSNSRPVGHDDEDLNHAS